jgi:hypothetical protein
MKESLEIPRKFLQIIETNSNSFTKEQKQKANNFKKYKKVRIEIFSIHSFTSSFFISIS